MLAPAVMFIEAAIESSPNVSDSIRKSQQDELTSLGEERVQALGASGLSYDFRKGYELGLQTARAILAGSPALMLGGIKPSDLL